MVPTDEKLFDAHKTGSAYPAAEKDEGGLKVDRPLGDCRRGGGGDPWRDDPHHRQDEPASASPTEDRRRGHSVDPRDESPQDCRRGLNIEVE